MPWISERDLTARDSEIRSETRRSVTTYADVVVGLLELYGADLEWYRSRVELTFPYSQATYNGIANQVRRDLEVLKRETNAREAKERLGLKKPKTSDKL